MITILDPASAYIFLVLFGTAMFLVTALASRQRKWHTAEGFMVAARRVPWWLGAISIAVSWIWAPALFVSVEQAYRQGIPGIFWFTLPNIICLFIMAPLALRIRKLFPSGFSQPEWIRHRFDRRTHIMYLIPFFWYQLMAVTVQLYAGGNIFALLTGTSVEMVMLVLAVSTPAYGALSGMRASIITDFLQYVLIVTGGLLVIPWTVLSAGGLSSVSAGLGGLGGLHRSILDPQVAYNFGIVTTIGLISGVLADQQHWQRAFSVEAVSLKKAYIVAGLMFGVVPIGLSLLGFLAANPALGIVLPQGVDPSMIGIVTVAHFLPGWAVLAFLVMLLAGLCSTLDSGLCAASSLYAMNCFKIPAAEQEALNKRAQGLPVSPQEEQLLARFDRKTLSRGRFAMFAITLLGLAVALAVIHIPGFGLKYLWWIFNTVAACVAVPTVLSLYWQGLNSRGVFWGVLAAFCAGIPLFVYANIAQNTALIVGSSLGIIAVTGLFALLMPQGAKISQGA